MPENPYINVLVTAVLTVIFIIACCYGLGYLARWIVKMRGATPKKAGKHFCRLFLRRTLDRGIFHFCYHSLGIFPLLEFHRLPGYIQRSCQLGRD